MTNNNLLYCKTENDVRERIIYPLLCRLGYTPGTITTQLHLSYKSLFIGHKKGIDKDKPLRGEADYVIDVDGRLRLVIEAKKPGPISEDDRDQAYSYAAHPQVRAVVFAVISGSHFEIFHTFDKPEVGAKLKFEYNELENNFFSLSSMIGPQGLRNAFPNFTPDFGRPLASGLRSYAKIEKGKITYTESKPHNEYIPGLIVNLDHGSILRNENGGMIAFINPSFHHQNLVQFSQCIGATKLEFLSNDEFLSIDAANPTHFRHLNKYTITNSTLVPDVTGSGNINPLVDIMINIEINVFGHLNDGAFNGNFRVTSNSIGVENQIQFSGEIWLQLR